jgi:hypothetical protein
VQPVIQVEAIDQRFGAYVAIVDGSLQGALQPRPGITAMRTEGLDIDRATIGKPRQAGVAVLYVVQPGEVDAGSAQQFEWSGQQVQRRRAVVAIDPIGRRTHLHQQVGQALVQVSATRAG